MPCANECSDDGPVTPVAQSHLYAAARLARQLRGRRVTVCLPARDEAATVGAIVTAVRAALVDAVALVDEVLVIDDGSVDATAELAAAAGARVVDSGGAGKGQAMWTGLATASGDVVVFCDADITGFTPRFITGLLGPLLCDEGVALVKGAFDRSLHGRPGEGGRVTELVARPLLRTLFPALAGIAQPLAGECAGPRAVLEKLPFVAGYGVDIGLLLDVADRHGADAVTQVDLGARTHRNRPLADLGAQAEVVLRTVLARAGLGPPVDECPPLVASAPPVTRWRRG